MITPKKIGKAIAKKFKNWRDGLSTIASIGTATDQIYEPNASSSINEGLSEEAKKQKLLEVLKKEMTIEHLDGREENHTILTDAILRKDSGAVREVLKLSEEYGILEEILNKKIAIKQADGQEISYTPFDYANENCKEIVKVIEKFKVDLNIPTKPMTDDIETVSTRFEDTNKGSEDLDIHLSICENSEGDQKDATQAPDSPYSAEPCDAARENQPTETTHQKQAILAGITGIALLICSIEFYALKIHVTVAVVVGIVGLMCMSFALYKALKPDTKLEKVESVKQPIASLESKGDVQKSIGIE